MTVTVEIEYDLTTVRRKLNGHRFQKAAQASDQVIADALQKMVPKGCRISETMAYELAKTIKKS